VSFTYSVMPTDAERSQANTMVSSRLSSMNTPPSPSLLLVLISPRISFVDLSYLDNDTGMSLLHKASHWKDLLLIELAVCAGADLFMQNHKGKMAHETAGKGDRVRMFLH
jgi:hypothetical protein